MVTSTQTATQTKRKGVNFQGKRKESRLWVRARVLGFKRSKVRQYENTSLLQLEGVTSSKAAQFYVGKRVAYLYKGENSLTSGSNTYKGYRVVWGKITRPHGNSGAVRAKFNPQLPPSAIAQTVRVFLFPSNI
ncbi:hypothetical protein FDP41_003241 [Naegleria fowleri]|uniref:Ribosomal protein L35Ae n=1 Tax=Naegleria fowleri TaxID=5763 RepID=A0A6A5BYB5_NAEFO|nr:uncharacterized protein FDP41_003241 [Naegleria fowleri]KAF0977919.1 hypothetical protein FDP41_003241 [Naegleria fowleri]CAG4715542.1 unnamed protein product [Naegleria fowleri]